MGLKNAQSSIELVQTAAGAGTYASGPIANAGAADHVLALVHISAVSGTTQTLNVVLQTSPDGTTWTTLASSAAPELTAVGNTSANADVSAHQYVQVLATVGGTGTPTVTFRVAVVIM